MADLEYDKGITAPTNNEASVSLSELRQQTLARHEENCS
jgi:hypothetical protein